MNKVRLEIIGMTYSESSTGAYVLILGDRNSHLRLPIVIGGAEAQSIAVGIERQKNSRPLTHDLFVKFADTFSINIREVVINRFRDGVFYAMLVCEHNGQLTMVDARPSDAIALAVRLNCEIFAYETVMEEAGIEMEDEVESEDSGELKDESEKWEVESGKMDVESGASAPLSTQNIEELEEQLREAIENEDYERAAMLRDKINAMK